LLFFICSIVNLLCSFGVIEQKLNADPHVNDKNNRADTERGYLCNISSEKFHGTFFNLVGKKIQATDFFSCLLYIFIYKSLDISNMERCLQ